jgi:hypothetical protein
MKTASLIVAVVTASALPIALSSFGCNKKEDAAPAPSATPAVVAPPATTTGPAAITPPVPPPSANIPLIKTGAPRADGGAAAVKSDAGPVVARADVAPPPPLGLPPGLPTIALPPASALPGLASSVVGGIIQNLPSPPIIPPPNPSQ